MADNGMIHRHERTPAERVESSPQARQITPAVDVFETEENLTLVADLPGVDRDGLEINLDKGVLTLHGEARPGAQGKAIFREFGAASYHRQFLISEQVDAAKSTADLSNGVLTLTLPKAEAAKPRKIEIRQ